MSTENDQSESQVRQNEIIEKIRDGTATEADQLELFRSVERFCQAIANKYRPALRCQGDNEDLMQEAFIQTIEAAKTYDPESGARFTTWLAFYLHNGFRMYASLETGQTRRQMDLRSKVRHFRNEYEKQTGKQPDDQTICRCMGISMKNLEGLSQSVTVISLDAELAENLSYYEGIPAPGSVEDEVIERETEREIKALLTRYVSELPQQQKVAAKMYYIDGLGLQTIADSLGVSYTMARSILYSADKKIKSPKHKRELSRFLPDRVGSKAYGRYSYSKQTSSTERTAIMLAFPEIWWKE